jgi:hypothetical protein
MTLVRAARTFSQLTAQEQAGFSKQYASKLKTIIHEVCTPHTSKHNINLPKKPMTPAQKKRHEGGILIGDPPKYNDIKGRLPVIFSS